LVTRARVALGLSAGAFGALFGADRRTVTRWEAGDTRVQGWVWVGIYFALRCWAPTETGLINALPVPSRALCPLVPPAGCAAGAG
jgi:hypothetical protein